MRIEKDGTGVRLLAAKNEKSEWNSSQTLIPNILF